MPVLMATSTEKEGVFHRSDTEIVDKHDLEQTINLTEPSMDSKRDAYL